MALYFSSINSGSNGNCYYVGNDTDAVLIDVGISCKEVEKRMNRLGLSIDKVKAIFISHEHSDHIKGLEVFANKYNLPVYINNATLKNSRLSLSKDFTFSFNESIIEIGNLKVHAFSKFHDAADPYSFVVEYQDYRVGVFTDIGSVCHKLIKHFKICHAAFLEANYDTKMLEEGRYPYFLKHRITGGKGHLSNDEALQLFRNHSASYMSHLLLSHLSKDNNEPTLAENMFKCVAGNTMVSVASRFKESPLYFLGVQENHFLAVAQQEVIQLNLF
ncbi:MBL fold metallo-hydrolase [Pedobacter changchengzhani]|uniref:MBL fold metallo-hydrolase n=1 Tax=Pedobacter changchengzhani TaxID=2529274 RepID=A0A4R5MK03_9SPHI|nr:MBL fold metallo-hydrolase [Pedobacter changchengzhani]TDG36017.1 MBL fold metallo-hydrolase [Pedobacter changchengzhani]